MKTNIQKDPQSVKGDTVVPGFAFFPEDRFLPGRRRRSDIRQCKQCNVGFDIMARNPLEVPCLPDMNYSDFCRTCWMHLVEQHQEKSRFPS